MKLWQYGVMVLFIFIVGAEIMARKEATVKVKPVMAEDESVWEFYIPSKDLWMQGKQMEPGIWEVCLDGETKPWGISTVSGNVRTFEGYNGQVYTLKRVHRLPKR